MTVTFFSAYLRICKECVPIHLPELPSAGAHFHLRDTKEWFPVPIVPKSCRFSDTLAARFLTYANGGFCWRSTKCPRTFSHMTPLGSKDGQSRRPVSTQALLARFMTTLQTYCCKQSNVEKLDSSLCPLRFWRPP